MEEIVGYANDHKMKAPLGFYKDAKLSIPREVELFILYSTDSEGHESKEAVSFKAPSCDTGKVSGIIDIAAGQLKFPLPKSFRMLTLSEIQERYNQPPFPDFVYLDEKSSALISLRFGNSEYDNASASKKLSELISTYSKSTPGIIWHKKEIVTKDGIPWIKLAMQSDSDIGKLYTEMLFTSFKGKPLSLYFVVPLQSLSLVRHDFAQTFNLLELHPRIDEITLANQSAQDKRAALSIEHLTQSSIRLRDVILKYPTNSWEVIKEEENKGVPSVDLVHKSIDGMIKATIQVLPSVVKAEPYLEVVTRSMRVTYESMKSESITTKIFAHNKFRCRQNEIIIKDQLPFIIETCIMSTHLKSVMLILGGATELYRNSEEEFENLLSGLEIGN